MAQIRKVFYAAYQTSEKMNKQIAMTLKKKKGVYLLKKTDLLKMDMPLLAV